MWCPKEKYREEDPSRDHIEIKSFKPKLGSCSAKKRDLFRSQLTTRVGGFIDAAPTTNMDCQSLEDLPSFNVGLANTDSSSFWKA